MTATREIPIINKLGMHVRAAAQFVQTANHYKSEVTVLKDGRSVNAKSIIGVLALAAGFGSKIMVEAKGDDAAECVDALAALAANKFGEERE